MSIFHYLVTGKVYIQYRKSVLPYLYHGFLQPDDTVVYAAGAFDLFHILLSMFRISQYMATLVFIFLNVLDCLSPHAGHVDFLQKCKEIGSFVIVGLHSDWVSPNTTHLPATAHHSLPQALLEQIVKPVNPWDRRKCPD